MCGRGRGRSETTWRPACSSAPSTSRGGGGWLGHSTRLVARGVACLLLAVALLPLRGQELGDLGGAGGVGCYVGAAGRHARTSLCCLTSLAPAAGCSFLSASRLSSQNSCACRGTARASLASRRALPAGAPSPSGAPGKQSWRARAWACLLPARPMPSPSRSAPCRRLPRPGGGGGTPARTCSVRRLRAPPKCGAHALPPPATHLERCQLLL